MTETGAGGAVREVTVSKGVDRSRYDATVQTNASSSVTGFHTSAPSGAMAAAYDCPSR